MKCPSKAVELITRFWAIPFREYGAQNPILLFRKGGTAEIGTAERLSWSYLLLANRYRFRVKKIGIYYSQYSYRHFIYLEVKADNVCCIEKYPDSNSMVEFGIKDEYKGNLHYRRYISREEYDDTPNCDLRICTLKRNNYLIFPKESIYNLRGSNFDTNVDVIMQAILEKKKSTKDLCDFMNSFAEQHRDEFIARTPSYTQNL